MLRPRRLLEEALAALVLRAVRANRYSARLRAGLRRLCARLDVRWSLVGGVELLLAATLEQRRQALVLEAGAGRDAGKREPPPPPPPQGSAGSDDGGDAEQARLRERLVGFYAGLQPQRSVDVGAIVLKYRGPCASEVPLAPSLAY